MKYKIISTTDDKNLGHVIENGQKEYILSFGFLFKPLTEIVNEHSIFLANSNYQIEGVRLDD
jgi:hypothetical protein